MAATTGQQVQAVPGNTKSQITVAISGVSVYAVAGFVAAPIKNPEVEWLIVARTGHHVVAQNAPFVTAVQLRSPNIAAEASRVRLYIEDEI
jgi:hypothetical protein